MEHNTILSGGIIVTEDNVLKGYSLIIKNGKIEEIVPEIIESENMVDCREKYILPELIDIHCDIIENHIVPRKGIVFDYAQALRQTDRQLIGQGITTIYHSISVANSTICNRNRTLSVENMLKIGDIVCNLAPNLLIHHYSHIRFELNTIEAYDEIYNRVKGRKVHELSFMNHAPGQGQYTNLESFKNEIKKQYGNITDKKANQIIEKCKNKPILDKPRTDRLIKLANEYNIPIAYHDVGSMDDIEFMLKHNIKICEFPLNLTVASKAIKHKFFNVVGAPNIMRNGSHNNLSAVQLIEQRLANVICSDYFIHPLC